MQWFIVTWCFLPLLIGLQCFKVPDSVYSVRNSVAKKSKLYGQGFGNNIPQETSNSITPGNVRNDGVERFLMMYTCKMCNTRNAQMISKVAYRGGMVISVCKSCRNKHLIADNENKLDFKEFGSNIEEYCNKVGKEVQKLNISCLDLVMNHLVDFDGKLTLVPKSVLTKVSHKIFEI